MITRRRFLQGTSGLAATSGLLPPAGKSGDRPNFLIFMPDQHQGQAVLPDYPTIMPNVRRFAAQGVTFRRAFCPSPHCCPSRASFQTGLYPSEHGVYNNVDTSTAIHPDPYPEVKYFSEALQKAGYQLPFSGKWHVGRTVNPLDKGWSVLYSQVRQDPGIHLKDSTWQQERAELPHEHDARRPAEIFRPGWGDWIQYGTRAPHGADGYEDLQDYKIVQAGVDWLRNQRPPNKPWCMFVSNSGGHDRYLAYQRFLDMYPSKSIPLPANFRDGLLDKPRTYQRMRYQYFSQLSDDEVRESIRHYWAMLTMQDELFGRLLDALEKTDQADNTIVIYTADHGDYAGAHGLWAKGIPSFREAYNIPCVVRWPRATRNAGRLVDAFVSMTDFAPTILDAAGVQPEAPMSGMSLLPWLRDENPANWRDAAFCQCNGVEVYYTQRIVMTDTHKYVYNAFDFDELYDLKNDPHEMVNLAFPNVPEAEAFVQQGRGIATGRDVPWPPLPPALDEVRRDMFKRLWKFGQEHKDIIFNPYVTVAMAPYGPAIEI